MKRTLSLVRPTYYVGVVVLYLLSSTAMAQKVGKDKTKRDFDQNCMRSGCHGQLNERPWVHGPVAVGSCDVCHTPMGPAKDHKYKNLRPKEKLCTYCHHSNAVGKVVHKVVTDEGCMKCHDPHGGVKRNLLKQQDEKKMCGECHLPEQYVLNPDLKALGKKAHPVKLPHSLVVPQPKKTKKGDLKNYQYIHKPITEGKCLVCHDAHSAPHKGLLPVSQRELCIACHKDWVKIKSAGLVIHDPAKEECLQCHQTHGGNVKKLLAREPKDLCLTCHKNVATSIETGLVPTVKMVPVPAKPNAKATTPTDAKAATVAPKGSDPAAKTMPPGAALATTPVPTKDGETKPVKKKPVLMKATYVDPKYPLHEGIKDVKSCLECHEHHAGHAKRLTKAKIDKPCYSCHKEVITVKTETIGPDGKKTVVEKKIRNVKKEIAEAKYPHGPVKDGSCLHCHKGHASKHEPLLTGAHSKSLYSIYSRDAYELCFTCHDERLAEQKESLSTQFRDKKRNLHYLHILDEGIKSSNVIKTKKRKGKSCNICHDVHGGMQAHLIKPTVPYGPNNWPLKMKYVKSKTGGSCEVACHKKQTYDNSTIGSSDDLKTFIKKKMKKAGLN